MLATTRVSVMPPASFYLPTATPRMEADGHTGMPKAVEGARCGSDPNCSRMLLLQGLSEATDMDPWRDTDRQSCRGPKHRSGRGSLFLSEGRLSSLPRQPTLRELAGTNGRNGLPLLNSRHSTSAIKPVCIICESEPHYAQPSSSLVRSLEGRAS